MTQVAAKASGTLRSAPLLNLLVYARSHRLTGSLVLEDRPGHRSGVVMQDGIPGKVRTADPVARLGPLLVEMGQIDQASAARTWQAAQSAGRLHGEVLLEEGILAANTLRLALREQIARKVESLALADLSTVWGFFEGQDFLASYGGALPVPVEPLTLIWRVAKLRFDANRVDKALAKSRPQPLSLRDPACVDRLALSGAERDLVELIAPGGVMLDNLLFVTSLDQERARTLLYVLALTGEVVTDDPTRAADATDDGESATRRGRQRSSHPAPATPAPSPSAPEDTSRAPLPLSFDLPPAPTRSPATQSARSGAEDRDSTGSAELSAHDRPTLAPPAPASDSAASGGWGGRDGASSLSTGVEGPQSVMAPVSGVTPSVSAAPRTVSTEVSMMFSLDALHRDAAQQAEPEGTRGSAGAAGAAGDTDDELPITVPPPAMPTLSGPALEAFRGEIVERARRLDSQSYYEVLGVPMNAGTPELRQTFLGLASLWHPSRLSAELGDARSEATRVFAHMAEAYQILIDPERRADYDAHLESSSPATDAYAEGLVEEHYRAASAALTDDDLDAALTRANQGLALDSENPKLLALYADLQSRRPERATLGDYDDLIDMVTRARKADPDDPRIRTHRARVLLRSGRELPAMREYRKVLEHDPTNAEAVSQLRLFKQSARIREGQAGQG